MKKAAAVFLAVIMTALICTSCLYYDFISNDPLIISHKYAKKLVGTWSDDSKNVIEIGLDDDTIGYIDCISTPDISFLGKSVGDWSIDNSTTLTVFWHSPLLFEQEENNKDFSLKITYTYANDLNDAIIAQGKDAVQEVYNIKNGAHQWYASDKYLCFDDLIFTDDDE